MLADRNLEDEQKSLAGKTDQTRRSESVGFEAVFARAGVALPTETRVPGAGEKLWQLLGKCPWRGVALAAVSGTTATLALTAWLAQGSSQGWRVGLAVGLGFTAGLALVAALLLPWLAKQERLMAERAEALLAANAQLQEATRQQYRLFAALVNTVPSPVYYKDRQARYQFCNDAFARQVLGLPLDRIVGRSVRDVPEAIPPALAELYWQHDAEILRQGGAQVYEAPVACPDGKTREFIFNKAVFRNEQGEIDGIIGFMTDVTQYRQAERELDVNRQRLSEAMELAHLADWEYDVASGMFTFNDRFYHQLATTAEAAGGYQMSAEAYVKKYVPPSEAHMVGQHIGLALATTDPEYRDHLESRVIRSDGQVRWVLVRVAIVKDAQGRTVTIRGVNQDITEQKAAEEELRQMRQAVEYAPGAVVITDLSGRIEYVNGKFVEITGYTVEEALGNNPRILKSGRHPAEFYEEMWETLRHGRVWRGEICNRRKSGPFFWESAAIAPVRNAQGEVTHFVALKEDITARKQNERELAASLQEKEILLREVYHRVKNNLQVISSLLNLQAASFSDEQTLRLIRETQERVRSMALVHEKLYQAKDLSHLDFSEYTRQLVQMLARSYRTTGPSIEVQFALEPIPLNLDTAVPCGLILNELVSNALKYAFPAGYPASAQPRLQVGLRTLGDKRYEMEVRDNGVGLPAHIDPRNTTTLGLQVVDMLSQQLGGGVGIQREAGTAFIVTFKPLRETSKSPQAPVAAVEKGAV